MATNSTNVKYLPSRPGKINVYWEGNDPAYHVLGTDINGDLIDEHMTADEFQAAYADLADVKTLEFYTDADNKDRFTIKVGEFDLYGPCTMAVGIMFKMGRRPLKNDSKPRAKNFRPIKIVETVEA